MEGELKYIVVQYSKNYFILLIKYLVFGIDISSFATEGFHSFSMTIPSSLMEGCIGVLSKKEQEHKQFITLSSMSILSLVTTSMLIIKNYSE